jgi:hypothetical protein
MGSPLNSNVPEGHSVYGLLEGPGQLFFTSTQKHKSFIMFLFTYEIINKLFYKRKTLLIILFHFIEQQR